MGILPRILIQINWQWLFGFAYIIAFVYIVQKSNRQLKDLMRFLKANSDDTAECIKRIKKYVARHPLSQANSLLRAMAVSSLIKQNDTEALNYFVRKIRCVDMVEKASDILVWDLFLLRELGYEKEYDLLRSKVKKSRVFFAEKLCALLTDKFVEESKFGELPLPKDSAIQTAVMAYYQGKKLWENGDFTQAKIQFENSQKTMPMIKQVLYVRGYSL